MEIDCFDKHSLHCLIQHKTSGVYAGTVRIIKPDFPNETLAIEKNNCIPTDDPALVLSPPNFRRDQIGEISRLAILRHGTDGSGRRPVHGHLGGGVLFFRPVHVEPRGQRERFPLLPPGSPDFAKDLVLLSPEKNFPKGLVLLP